MRAFFLLILGFVLIVAPGCGANRAKLARKTKDVYLVPLSRRDSFQAGHWLRIAQDALEVNDYPTTDHFCNLLMKYYPYTQYAQQAEILKEEIADPKLNRKRTYRKNNPGLFFND